jgi:sortase A
MRIAGEIEPLRRILAWTRRALFASAFLLLGYCAFALVDARIFQRRASIELDRLRPELSASPKGAPWAEPDGLIGRVKIPRLRISFVVVEGVDRKSLRRAVGHISGTALPGEAGNVGLAAHRDTFFRPLKDLRIKDEIQFSTRAGNFKYEVVSLRVVEPDNVGVLASAGENVLTMVTCYPFYYVGPAPKRWIVRARQVLPQTAPPSTVE